MFKLVSSAAVALAAVSVAAGAHAGNLLFSYVEPGGFDISFEQASTPSPEGDLDGNFTETYIWNFSGNDGDEASIVWFDSQQFGGFQAPDATPAIRTVGSQVFTGSEAAPVFAPGVFTGIYDYSNGLTGTLTISSVPEPATWAIMLLGLGALGGAMRVSRHETLA
jgi:hypothetical protein